ncbi:hypothetical protein B0H14DRAFT_2632733 [Mycena olivaceomarginata]|nr:hypothetical protein B0H14DRAFT_2632733 [Mycena olivaceomarginata]
MTGISLKNYSQSPSPRMEFNRTTHTPSGTGDSRLQLSGLGMRASQPNRSKNLQGLFFGGAIKNSKGGPIGPKRLLPKIIIITAEKRITVPTARFPATASPLKRDEGNAISVGSGGSQTPNLSVNAPRELKRHIPHSELLEIPNVCRVQGSRTADAGRFCAPVVTQLGRNMFLPLIASIPSPMHKTSKHSSPPQTCIPLQAHKPRSLELSSLKLASMELASAFPSEPGCKPQLEAPQNTSNLTGGHQAVLPSMSCQQVMPPSDGHLFRSATSQPRRALQSLLPSSTRRPLKFPLPLMYPFRSQKATLSHIMEKIVFVGYSTPLLQPHPPLSVWSAEHPWGGAPYRSRLLLCGCCQRLCRLISEVGYWAHKTVLVMFWCQFEIVFQCRSSWRQTDLWECGASGRHGPRPAKPGHTRKHFADGSC